MATQMANGANGIKLVPRYRMKGYTISVIDAGGKVLATHEHSGTSKQDAVNRFMAHAEERGIKPAKGWYSLVAAERK